jgi:hypothetical protein
MESGEQLRKVNALRLRKRVNPEKLTGANHPPTAFVMMGHGKERTTNKRVVPEGCILVVQIHSGELNYFIPNFYSNIFNDPEKDRYLDPIANYKYITDKINIGRGISENTPLAIYIEGDEYPEFVYTLISYLDTDLEDNSKNPRDSFKIKDSGIAQYPFIEGEAYNEIIRKDVEGKEIFLNLYNKSTYPPRAEIEQIIDEIPGTKNLNDIIYSSGIEKKLTIRQSELFKILGKGVYYNLVCRFTSPKLLVNDIFTKRKIINNNQRSLVNSSLHLRKNRPEILQAIGEAEGQRQGFIGRLNKSREATYVPRPQVEINVTDIINNIKRLKSEPTKINLVIIRQLQNKYYSLLKEEYLSEMRYYEDPINLAKLIRILGEANAQREMEKSIKKVRVKLDELEKAQYGQPVTPVKNEAHELVLQEQMRKQRAAHAAALNKAAKNNANIVNIAEQVGITEQPVPVQLVENNVKGFNQRRANAEKEAAAAVAAWKKKGGKQTRKFKKYKNKTRRK